LVGKPERKKALVDGRIIFEWIEEVSRVWTDSSGSEQGLDVRCCEYGNGTLGPIKASQEGFCSLELDLLTNFA
jgi:hypothetical protein